MPWYEFVGYAGSVLVAVSLMMSNILKLRWINLAGASTFALYGGIIGAYPVLLLNGFITLVDIYYLIGMYKQKDYFEFRELTDPNGFYLNRFLDFYKDDIKKFFPEFDKAKLTDAKFTFILRNLVPAGLFIYVERSPGTIEILLDYATPDYRDFKNARFLYRRDKSSFHKQGYKKLIAKSENPIHIKYLLKLGFEKEDDFFVKIY